MEELSLGTLSGGPLLFRFLGGKGSYRNEGGPLGLESLEQLAN